MAAQLAIQIVGDDQSQGAFASLGDNLGKIPGASEIATGALRQIGAIGVDALGQAAGAAVGLVKDSLDAAGTFESKMNVLSAVLGESLGQAGFDMQDVSAKALELGANTQFSAAQAQEAMIALAKGGVPVVDIMGAATDASLNLAAAGGIELAQAADIVAKQLGVWAETGVTATQAADLLAQAANASTVDVDELALGMANVGGTAKAAGVDFGELTQTMALIAPNFSSAADAGTSLKTFIANLQPDTKPAIAAMKDLGLYTAETGSAFYDAQGNFVGMEETARLLAEATKDLSEEQRVQALNTIFGSDAIRAAGAIAAAGADGFNEMGAAMGMAGDAASQAAKMNTGYQASMSAMKGSIETVQIVLGTALLPILTQLINQVLTPAINTVLAFAQGITSARDPLAALTAQVSALVPGFSTFMGYAREAWAALQPLVSLIQANLVPILISLAAVAGGALVVALGGMVASLAAAAAPIIALVAVGALLYNAWQSNFGGIRDLVSAVMGALWSVISSIVGQISAFWQSNGAQILGSATAIWGQIQVVIASAIQLVQVVVVGVLTVVGGFIDSHGAQIQAALLAAWQIITSAIGGALSLIQGLITAALRLIQGDFSGAWEAVQAGAADFVEGLLGVLEGAVDLLGNAGKLMTQAVVDGWNSFTD